MFSSLIILLVTSLLGVVAWVGNRLVNTLDRMDSNINSIDKTLSALVAKHDDLEERVEKVEGKIYNGIAHHQ